MTPRARRVLTAAIAVVVLLYSGRWLADFLTTRWWAAAISPAAVGAVTRWQLLGLALDAGAVAIASCWFALQGLLVARAIGSVQVQRHVGDELVRELVPTRWLVAGAIALGVLLGLLTGAGAAAWRAPLLLALNTPTYGIADPLLGVDLGVLVARYPMWQAAHGFAVILAVLGLVLSLALYAAIGAFARRDKRVEIHPDARRHLGGLIVVLALIIAAGFLLAPYRLATSIDVPLSTAAATTRVLASHAAAGASIAAAALSALWMLRGRVSLLIGGWLVLVLAAITERLVVPAFAAEAGSAVERAQWQRQMDSVFHGIVLVQGNPSPDTLPRTTAVWDEASLHRWASGRGERMLAFAQVGTTEAPYLLVATAPDSEERITLTRIAPDQADADGLPVRLDTHDAEIRAPRSVPGAVGWALVDSGVKVGRTVAPLAMAWSLQAPGILNIPASATIDWLRDPVDRVSALIPPLHWYPMGFSSVDGRLVWVMSGLASVARAPMATRIAVGGQTLSGVVPAVIAVVTAETGGVQFYPDPSAGPLGTAWQAAFRSLISPLRDLPDSVLAGLSYPPGWFELQVPVLAKPHWGLGVPATTTVQPARTWVPSPGALQVTMEEPEHRRTLSLLAAVRIDGRASIREGRLPTGTPSAVQLAEAWMEMPPVVQLTDSLRAAGDSLIAGPIFWHDGAGGVFAWQPMYALSQGRANALMWVGTASPNKVSGGRRTQSAWASARDDSTGAGPSRTAEEQGRIEAIRTWMQRGDSALARGDLTAFARAWEALRGLLLDTVPR